ncbi:MULTISPECIES: Scr1 family TA system antitoxin-like transcriptional regulator [Amycolatopsis]|uniref:Transcriptional regulator n=1 Tax=Amycolatopsis bullii TaxID=941987 RepID=A0ABQ3KSL2_9PSEU|nr:Scr1 family TA system antitoxin-like transcriptional regulator [Amycolatopsis bullii]GHG29947.1 transcriptional regulator [Amycolatopsis bullii]
MRTQIHGSRHSTNIIQSPATVAVGQALRTLRTARGIGLRRLAAKLELRAQVLSNWETAKRIPPITVVAQLLGALQADSATTHRILDQARHASDPAFVDLDHWDHATLASHYEQLATHVFAWAPTLIPDPLRTPEHDLYLLNHPVSDIGHADAPSLLAPARRNNLADRERHYTFLVGDAALRACPPQLRTDQLGNLERLATKPNITLLIVPADVCPPGLISAFTLYSDHTVALAIALHHYRASTYLADRDTLAAYQRVTHKLRHHGVDLQDIDETPLRPTDGTTQSPDAAETP